MAGHNVVDDDVGIDGAHLVLLRERLREDVVHLERRTVAGDHAVEIFRAEAQGDFRRVVRGGANLTLGTRPSAGQTADSDPKRNFPVGALDGRNAQIAVIYSDMLSCMSVEGGQWREARNLRRSWRPI